MTLPGLRDWIFSLKTFGAALAALYIAFALGLDRPYWAMATVYITSQPLTGAMRSKSAFRFLGTLIGGVAAVVLVPNLVNAPVLLSGALALWTGTCLFFALLDRTPRSYVFMLAGYTAAIIGFPSVDAPGGIFETALLRIEETTLGIVCSTVIGTVVFPRPVGPVIIGRLDDWFATARNWIYAVLAGKRDEESARAARRAMAGASVEVGMLVTHLAYDTSLLQIATRPVSVMLRRMMLLLPVISGIGDRLLALRRVDAMTPEVQGLLDDFAAWLRAGGDKSEQETARMQGHLAAAAPDLADGADWPKILRASLVVRLAELADIAHDVQALRRQVLEGSPSVPPLLLPPGLAPDSTRYHDYGMALLSAFAAAVAVGLICAFWIATAWTSGAIAAMQAAVLCTFFAAQDDPVPAIMQFLYCTVIAIAINTVYLFAILPLVTGFEMLALALAPVYIVLGVLIAMPPTFMIGLATAVNAASMLALTETYNANFADYANTALASIVGMASAATVTAVIRSVGASWSARRLRRAGWRDIARAASPRGTIERSALTALMLDQLADLTSRLAASDLHADLAVQAALRDLRVGLNVVDLDRESPELSADTRAHLRSMLDGIERYYRERVPAPPDMKLLALVDAAIAAVTAVSTPLRPRLLMQLVGIRFGLFPEASPHAGTMAAAPMPAAAAAAAVQ